MALCCNHCIIHLVSTNLPIIVLRKKSTNLSISIFLVLHHFIQRAFEVSCYLISTFLSKQLAKAFTALPPIVNKFSKISFSSNIIKDCFLWLTAGSCEIETTCFLDSNKINRIHPVASCLQAKLDKVNEIYNSHFCFFIHLSALTNLDTFV